MLLQFRKNVLHSNIFSKTRTVKYQENFGENYFKNDQVKFLQDKNKP